MSRKRETAVRPDERETKKTVAAMDGGLGDHEEDAHNGPREKEGAEQDWEELADKYDQLEKQVKDYLDDQQSVGVREPPIINAPSKMTKEEWEKAPSHPHTILGELQTLRGC